MRFAALLSWLLTAGLGAFMLRAWLARGGLDRDRARDGGLPPKLIFSHAALAIAGLLMWAAYLALGARPLAWAAVGMLTLTVGLGLSTVTLWTPYPAREPGERRGSDRLDVPAVVVPDIVAAAADAPGPEEPVGYQVTDEMIARLFADPVPAPRSPRVRPNPAVLVPVAHGAAALATFLLALLSAIP